MVRKRGRGFCWRARAWRSTEQWTEEKWFPMSSNIFIFSQVPPLFRLRLKHACHVPVSVPFIFLWGINVFARTGKEKMWNPWRTKIFTTAMWLVAKIHDLQSYGINPSSKYINPMTKNRFLSCFVVSSFHRQISIPTNISVTNTVGTMSSYNGCWFPMQILQRTLRLLRTKYLSEITAFP